MQWVVSIDERWVNRDQFKAGFLILDKVPTRLVGEQLGSTVDAESSQLRVPGIEALISINRKIEVRLLCANALVVNSMDLVGGAG